MLTQSRKLAPVVNEVSDIGAKDLLGALVAFLQPLIQRQVSSSKPNDEDLELSSAEAINGAEGKNLLSALTTFVTVVVNSPPKIRNEQALDVSPKPGATVDANRYLPKEVARSDLERMTLDAARAHVFNKMPIRLLTFDKDGSNIQLIGRNEIYSCILPGVFMNIAKSKFQEDWAAAEVQEEKYRQNKLKALLQGAVEQSVQYAILSHTWMRDMPGEVTFHDWAVREDNPRGNTKITRFCEVTAREHNTTLGWIDTVCIDKSSSSELDESIRSMYNWYRRASVCIIYLSQTTDISNAHHDSWFTRGWTLQELLAPARGVFYNEIWKQLGSSNDAEIQSVIKTASGVSSKELKLSWRGAVESIPLSRRLQMACGRQVTREEDTSYSLMGILGVDISIAYGEGASRAFFRLVRELFNTKKNVIDLFNRSYNWGEGLLPSSLEFYRHRIDNWDNPNGGTYLDKYLPLDPIIPTHLGMRIPLLLAPWLVADTVDDQNYVAKGALSAKMPIAMRNVAGDKSDVVYLLCDKRLYTGDLTNLRTPNHNASLYKMKHISAAGIVNFGIDTNNHIMLPEHSLSLRLDWHGLEEGNFTPSGNVVTYPGNPYHFKLESKKGFRIPKAELEEHGMQLVSLYL